MQVANTQNMKQGMHSAEWFSAITGTSENPCIISLKCVKMLDEYGPMHALMSQEVLWGNGSLQRMRENTLAWERCIVYRVYALICIDELLHEIVQYACVMFVGWATNIWSPPPPFWRRRGILLCTCCYPNFVPPISGDFMAYTSNMVHIHWLHQNVGDQYFSAGQCYKVKACSIFVSPAKHSDT